MLESFAPIVDDDSQILVLGSMPGRESLMAGEYYRNQRNAFWRIISILFNNGQPLNSYEEKVACLRHNHIALWDTIKYCDREGSLDSNIRNAVRNDIAAFLKQYPNIKRVIANGATAAKNVDYLPDVLRAHSTSPACTIPFGKKLEEWRELLMNQTVKQSK